MFGRSESDPLLDRWRKEQKPAAERARKEDHREGNPARMNQRLGRRVRDSSREKFKAGKYCRSTRVVLRAPSAGWPPEEGSRVDTNLLDEVQEQTAKIEEESIGRDEQEVAASSGMWGEKYRDEMGLERVRGTTDLLDKPAGGHPN